MSEFASLIIQNASIDKNSVIRSLVTAFESDNKLEPTNVLSRMLNIQVTESNTQVMQRVKDSAALFCDHHSYSNSDFSDDGITYRQINKYTLNYFKNTLKMNNLIFYYLPMELEYLALAKMG